MNTGICLNLLNEVCVYIERTLVKPCNGLLLGLPKMLASFLFLLLLKKSKKKSKISLNRWLNFRYQEKNYSILWIILPVCEWCWHGWRDVVDCPVPNRNLSTNTESSEVILRHLHHLQNHHQQHKNESKARKIKCDE